MTNGDSMTNVISLNKSAGFTRMGNDLMEAVAVIELPGRELRVLMAIARKTIGYQQQEARITADEIGKMTNMRRDVASKAVSHLLERKIIHRIGGSRGEIGISPVAEWVFVEPKNECLSETISSHSAQVVSLSSVSSETKTATSLLYSKKEPLVTVPSEQITAPLVSFDGEDFHVDASLIAKWAEKYSSTNIENEVAKAAEWAAANPRKAKKDWRRFLINWLGNAEDKAKQGLNEAGIPVDKVIALYHKTCPNLPAVAVPSDKVLRSLIVERWSESDAHQNSDFWRTIFDRANRTNQVFFRGENVTPRLEAICSRAIFRSLEERA